MSSSHQTNDGPSEGIQLVLLGGLPGSGKTFYAKQLEKLGWVIFDDFQSRAAGDSPQFRASRFYKDLLLQLRNGQRCIVADIRVVHDEYRQDLVRTLGQELGDLATEVHLFENDPGQCAKNVRNAEDSRDAAPRLEAIEFWSGLYSIPLGATIHRVWRPPTESREPQR